MAWDEWEQLKAAAAERRAAGTGPGRAPDGDPPAGGDLRARRKDPAAVDDPVFTWRNRLGTDGEHADRGTGTAPAPPKALPADFDPVCLPAHPVRQGEHRGVDVELRRTTSGEKVAVVFTSPDALADALGEHQPWIAVPMLGARNLVVALGVRRILVDPAVSPEVPRWTEDDVRAVGDLLDVNGGGEA